MAIAYWVFSPRLIINVLIVHETGNEPGISEDTFGSDGKKAKVPHVELQLQGRFKHAAKVDQNAKGDQ